MFSSLPGAPGPPLGRRGLVPVSEYTSAYPSSTLLALRSSTVALPFLSTLGLPCTETSAALRGSTVQPSLSTSEPEVAVIRPSSSGPLRAAPSPIVPASSNAQGFSLLPSMRRSTVTFLVLPAGTWTEDGLSFHDAAPRARSASSRKVAARSYFLFDFVVLVMDSSISNRSLVVVTDGMPKPTCPPKLKDWLPFLAFCRSVVVSQPSANTDGAARTSPLPTRVTGLVYHPLAAGVWLPASAPLRRRALTSRGVAFSCLSRMSAATPVTTGAAPDVPPKLATSVLVCVWAASQAPGAPMSGLAR